MPVVTCEKCGAKNRVEEGAARKNVRAVCGRCGAELTAGAQTGRGGGAGAQPINVSDATFAREVLGGGLPVLLDCWAAWCAPCRLIAPIVDQLAAESEGRYVVAKLNVDENPQTASRFNVRSIPTLLIFDKQGRLVETIIGAQPKQAIAARLAAHI
ncbi:MAG TPA: thioredoxin [Pyrinomonadaceae bacterium]|nr:thioredoxin [Pyrinomonadaceae bacterium]